MGTIVNMYTGQTESCGTLSVRKLGSSLCLPFYGAHLNRSNCHLLNKTCHFTLTGFMAVRKALFSRAFLLSFDP
jgi:hypothetical protein